MRRFPVVNLGQMTDFVGSACKAVDTYNDWDGWEDTPTGSSAQAGAVAALQSLVNQLPAHARAAGIQQIRDNCPNSAAILDMIHKPQITSTPPLIPTGVPVASVDPLDFGPYTPPPPPPNTNPPVATGQPGPGRGAFGWRPSVATGQFGPGYMPPGLPDYEPVTTGSEAPPPVETPTPPPTPFQPSPPMVPTGGAGCWYTPGQGYSWGARPPGSETTGLNKSDCENIMRYDQQIRGQALNIPAAEPVQATQFTQETAQATQYSQTPTPANMQPAIQTRPDVASTMCPQGQFWDGRQCRGSVAPGFGNLMNVASMGPSGGVAAPTFGGEAYSSGGAPGAFSMAGRRYPVVNL